MESVRARIYVCRPPDSYPWVAGCYLCCKVLTTWAAAELGERRGENGWPVGFPLTQLVAQSCRPLLLRQPGPFCAGCGRAS